MVIAHQSKGANSVKFVVEHKCSMVRYGCVHLEADYSRWLCLGLLLTVFAVETANDSYLAQSFGQMGYWAYLGQEEQQNVQLCVLVNTILKIVVDERLVNQRGVWDGSSEVRGEDWVRNGKVIGMGGFGVVLLSVWTWWGTWVQGNVYYGGWMICCRKRRKSGVWCSGDKINLLSGAYMLCRFILG